MFHKREPTMNTMYELRHGDFGALWRYASLPSEFGTPSLQPHGEVALEEVSEAQ